ncbi:hypothetical protein CBM2606_A90474 [Cupriavidus taiwanensis]|nr:hypothetical protein CBM2606_A90474 [Cupriavidus taiwanensis]
MLPLPLAGEGWGEGGRVDEVQAVGIASACPHPLPLSRKRERGANRRSATCRQTRCPPPNSAPSSPNSTRAPPNPYPGPPSSKASASAWPPPSSRWCCATPPPTAPA